MLKPLQTFAVLVGFGWLPKPFGLRVKLCNVRRFLEHAARQTQYTSLISVVLHFTSFVSLRFAEIRLSADSLASVRPAWTCSPLPSFPGTPRSTSNQFRKSQHLFTRASFVLFGVAEIWLSADSSFALHRLAHFVLVASLYSAPFSFGT